MCTVQTRLPVRQVDVVPVPRDPDVLVEALDHGHEIHLEKVPGGNIKGVSIYVLRSQNVRKFHATSFTALTSSVTCT